MDFLFMAEVPTNKTAEEIQQERLEAWRKEWSVQTHRHEETWYAHQPLSDECSARLELQPTDSHLTMLQLMEEDGWATTGRTELDACERLAVQLDMGRP